MPNTEELITKFLALQEEKDKAQLRKETAEELLKSMFKMSSTEEARQRVTALIKEISEVKERIGFFATNLEEELGKFDRPDQ